MKRPRWILRSLAPLSYCHARARAYSLKWDEVSEASVTLLDLANAISPHKTPTPVPAITTLWLEPLAFHPLGEILWPNREVVTFYTFMGTEAVIKSPMRSPSTRFLDTLRFNPPRHLACLRSVGGSVESLRRLADHLGRPRSTPTAEVHKLAAASVVALPPPEVLQ
jgi:hypothetical protein